MENNFLKKFLSLGVSPELTGEEIKRIKLTNGISIIIAAVCLTNIVVGSSYELIVSGSIKIGILPLINLTIAGLISLMSLFLNAKKRYSLAKINLQVLGGVLVFALSILYGDKVRIDQYFIVLISFPFGLYPWGRKIIISVILNALLFITCNIYYLHFPAIINIPDAYSQIFFLLNSIMSIFMTVLILAYVSKQNESYQRALSGEIEKNKETSRKLAQANADKDKFLSIIAHDLKGPIGSLANIFKHVPLERLTPKVYKQFQSATNNTYELIQDLLTWARAQKDNIEIEPLSFEINELFNDIIPPFNQSIHQKKIQLKIEDGENNVFAFADIPSIKTVIRNLISNAIKFTNEGGTITLIAAKENNIIKVIVKDTGVGISPDKISMLFRIGSSITSPGTQNEKGTGLGLLLCKEFVELNKGEIGVDSTQNQGSEFWFTLPVGAPIHLNKVLQQVIEKQFYILVVEDNLLNMENTVNIITKAGIRCDRAKNGEEAVELGTIKNYHFILMDIDIPKINGIEANKIIRNKFPQSIIIALSSHQRSEILKMDGNVKFDYFLRKPLILNNLLHCLNKLFLS